MDAELDPGGIRSLVSLRAIRTELTRARGWRWVALVATVYAGLSMYLGGMFVAGPVQGDYYVAIVFSDRAVQWWNYPFLLIVQPWGIISLPFFPTVAMVLVSIGVGVGAAVGIALLAPRFRGAAGADAGSAAAGAVAGAGPAITGLATLGACCCTGCAGLVGVTVVAAASGASLDELLLNNWYIGVFQLGVVFVSLLAEERALRLRAVDCSVPPPMDRRFAAGALLRIGLLIAGITWSLAMFVEWSDISPWTAGTATWYHWIFEHQLLALTAIAAGLFPKEFAGIVRRPVRRALGVGRRVLWGLAGITWGIGVPVALVEAGLGGFVNELLGVLGAPSSLGAEAPDAPLGAPLYFHWIAQHLLLSGFALALALAPVAATAPLLWTVAGGRGAPGPAPRGSPPGEERTPSSPAPG